MDQWCEDVHGQPDDRNQVGGQPHGHQAHYEVPPKNTQKMVFVTLILRGIKVGWSRALKSAFWAHFEVLNYDFYEFLHILKVEIYHMKQIQSC